VITADYALQVGDRLLTRVGRGHVEEWDLESNKSAILLATDGLVSMSYAGQAHMSGTTTDSWIAEVLQGGGRGDKKGPDRYAVQRGPGAPRNTLGKFLLTLVEALNAAVATRVLDRNVGFAMHFVGLRWRRRSNFAWPCYGEVYWSESHGAFRIRMSKRYWGWLDGLAEVMTLGGPSRHRARQLMIERFNLGDLADSHRTADVVVEVLRSLSTPNDLTIGNDCLITTIRRTSPHVVVKYEPYAITHFQVATRTEVATVPACYTPWVVAPGLIAAPQTIVGSGWSFHLAGFDVLIDAPESGGIAAASSQKRRRWPG
jgi:hypothetical protein